VRPRASSYSVETLWALLNSPVANAYAFSHLGKRDNIVGDIRKTPVPKVTSFESVQRAATAYLEAASSETDSATLQKLLLHVDCEILKLYSLPLHLEQSLLAIFTGWKRAGVPFTQCRYLPEKIEQSMRFSDFLQFEEDWSVTNRVRGELIDRGIAGTLSAEERARLDALQTYADYHIDEMAPRPAHLLDELEDKLLSNIRSKHKDL
jgi:hypothetical protein